MIAFGRARVPLVIAAAVLLVWSPGDEGPTKTVEALESLSTSTTSTTTNARPRTTDRDDTTTAPPPVTTAGADATSTTTSRSTTTTGRAGDTTTTSRGAATTTTTRPTTSTAPPSPAATTTTSPPPCPSGGIAWDIGFDASSAGQDRWAITISGSLVNRADAAIEVTAVLSTVELTSPDGTVRRETVRSKADPRTIGAGGGASVSGSATTQSSTDPRYRGTTIEARWADRSARESCPPPS